MAAGLAGRGAGKQGDAWPRGPGLPHAAARRRLHPRPRRDPHEAGAQLGLCRRGLGAQNQVRHRASSTRSTSPNARPSPRARTIRSPTPPTTSPSTSSRIPSTRTCSGRATSKGQSSETARLHTERESLTFPTWAWPDRGDRVSLVGSWVWDCDHYDRCGRAHGDPSVPRPLGRAESRRPVAEQRSAGDREADLFVTTAGTPADRQALCALDRQGRPRGAFKTCVDDTPFTKRSRRRGRNVRAEGRAEAVALGASRLPRRRSRRRHAGPIRQGRGRRRGLVRTRAGGTIAKRSSSAGGRSRSAGRSTCVSASTHCSSGARWIPVARRTTRTVPSRTSPSCSARSRPLRASGTCTSTRPASGASGCRRCCRSQDGQTIRSKQTIDLYVAKGKPWRLFVQTRECDFGSLGNAYSVQGSGCAVPAHQRGRQHRERRPAGDRRRPFPLADRRASARIASTRASTARPVRPPIPRAATG